MAFTNTGGGDHEGLNWTPDGDTIAGVHYNIDTFSVSNGQTATIDVGTELEVYCNTGSVVGIIQGNVKGFIGGDCSAGTGPGGGGRGNYSGAWGGGGGAGYAGIGGAGVLGNPGAGGAEYDYDSEVLISMGSGGGGAGDSANPPYTGHGGYGGGSVSIYANAITVTGTISCDGGNAYGNTGGYGGGGGGSGGGILLVCDDLTATGTFNVAGGNGAQNGGGGSAGRIIFMYNTIDTSGITTDTSAGTGTNNGSVGTYNTAKLANCTSTIIQGQTFTIGATNPSIIDKVTLWVTAVSTSGDFILKVWDSISKNTEYGTKTVTISGTGSTDFEFADWIRIPDGESTYYMELTTAGAGDIEIGVYGISTLVGGDAYRNVHVVSRFDLYHQIYSVDHVKNPSVYNTADTTTKTDVANVMLIGAAHTINTDGTGTLQYTDGFTTNKYLGDYNTLSGVTHDAGNDELDIADAGYITYLIDTKYPINGIPQLTSTIDITAGTPTIQISSNGSTWYDIDTAIVDDTSTVYPLDNVSNLSLDQLTSFYLRFDCAGDGTNTATIKTFTLDLNITTIDAENFYVNTGASNTMRCDQATDSGIDCVVLLTYRDRAWA